MVFATVAATGRVTLFATVKVDRHSAMGTGLAQDPRRLIVSTLVLF